MTGFDVNDHGGLEGLFLEDPCTFASQRRTAFLTTYSLPQTSLLANLNAIPITIFYASSDYRGSSGTDHGPGRQREILARLYWGSLVLHVLSIG